MNTIHVKKLTILIIDDDENIREKLSNLFLKLSADVLIAKDGLEGLELIKTNTIDVVISDITMPKLDGLSLIEEIRKFDKNLDFIIISSHVEPDYLMKAIKHSALNYLAKPINMRELVERVNEIGEIKHQQIIIENKEKENQEYINILNQITIVSKTDLKGKIKYVNDVFCEISGYTKEELIGKSHSIVRHPDMPSAAFEDLWATIKSNNIWRGKVKNLAKDGSSYFVNTTVYPILDDTGQIYEYMSVRFLITDDEIEKRKFKQKVMKTIVDNKRQNMIARVKIDELQSQVRKLKHLEPLRDKNIKLKSQVNYYEDRIKKLDDEYYKSRKALKEESGKFYNDLKDQRRINEMSMKKIKSLNAELQQRETEYKKLNNQVLEQSKIIKDLRDVIEHREEQLESKT
ncbi:MAG: response regulator [Campylobacterota bacterium]